MGDKQSQKLLKELRQRLLRFDADLRSLKCESETFILDQLELARECIADAQLLAVKAITYDGEERELPAVVTKTQILYRKICSICGQTFDSASSRAKFCFDRSCHREKHRREAKRSRTKMRTAAGRL
jgi:hypothetical protein